MKKIIVGQDDIIELKDVINFTKQTWERFLSQDNGNTKQEFLDAKIPDVDVPHPETPTPNFCYDKDFIIEDRIEARILLRQWCRKNGGKQLTNSIVYKPNTLMKWHTNSDNKGIRRYYTYTNGSAWFAYQDENGKIVYDQDNKGWTIREFETPVWHSIFTENIRFSFGMLMNV